ncbi:hypothetical protein EQM14_16005 [Caproiciproducens sp. NJN-50]|uniref:hypothetical protein n=1 Tax=Acutalibacteraceae TaxID=3082771 RepID=UPI000FFE0DFB|nr:MULTISPECIES: hypothetical protein [Acutalibacteraceae]QAT51154.1 hypothetical protein EQM14_16005 [Caproiciproducens sp. NJN-50]
MDIAMPISLPRPIALNNSSDSGGRRLAGPQEEVLNSISYKKEVMQLLGTWVSGSISDGGCRDPNGAQLQKMNGTNSGNMTKINKLPDFFRP